MTVLRHIAFGLVALLVLLLGGAWAVPPWLDWDRYRDDVAGLASAALGQQVRIDGAISLRLLPQPLLVAERVAVEAGGAGASVTAEKLMLRVALAPLLGGRVDARELVLRGADIRLPWPLDPAALALRTPSWLSSLSARIERGRLRVGEMEVTGLNATLATSDLSGSFLSAGRARGGGKDWVFTARVSQPGGDGAVGIDVTLDGQGAAQGVGAVLSGQMQPDGTTLGRVSVRGPDLSQLMPAPAAAFRAEGRLIAGGGLVAADEVVGELAGSPIQGAVALRVTPSVRLDVALTASRLDLDTWWPALIKGGEGGALAWLPIGIDISAEAAPLAGGTLRGLRGALDIEGGTVRVRELRAILPGEAALRVEGRVAAAGRGPRQFTGAARLEAPALRTTLAWAAAAGLGPVNALPPGVLRAASLGGEIVLSDGQIALSALEGAVDGAHVTGILTWRGSPRPALTASLAVDRLELDDWLPSAWPGLARAALQFGASSLDLRLAAARADWRGLELAPLLLDLAAGPGRVALRRLEVQGLGARLVATGTLFDDGRVADGRAEFRTDRAAGLAPVLLPLFGEWLAPLLRGPLQAQVQADGKPEALGIVLAGALGDLRVEATPTLDLSGGHWAGGLTVRHPGAPRLAEMLGLDGATAWLGDGSLAVVAQLAGSGERITADTFDLTAGGLRARGALRLDRGAVPKLTGRIDAETLPLPLPYPRSPVPLPLAMLSGWEMAVQLAAVRVMVAQEKLLDGATAELKLAGGEVRLDGLLARLGGGRVSGAIAFDAAARPPTLVVQAAAGGVVASGPVFDAPLDIAAGVLDGTLRLTASGYAPVGLLATLGGRVSLSGRDGVLAGIDLARMGVRLEEADLRAALSGGSTAFERLDAEGEIDRGGLKLVRAALFGPAGSVMASGTIDLTRAILALRLAMLPAVADAPEIGLRVSGPVDATERVPELAGAVRWRAAHPP